MSPKAAVEKPKKKRIKTTGGISYPAKTGVYDATRHIYRFNQLYAVEEQFESLVESIVVPNNLMQYRW